MRRLPALRGNIEGSISCTQGFLANAQAHVQNVVRRHTRPQGTPPAAVGQKSGDKPGHQDRWGRLSEPHQAELRRPALCTNQLSSLRRAVCLPRFGCSILELFLLGILGV